MSVFEIILISMGLAMDAFGVSIGKGLSMPVGENRRKVTLAFLFGLFQFLMPVIGWLIGRQFIDVISEWDHWIIFGLLGYLGIAMIREGLSDEDDEDDDKQFLGVWEMMMLSVATSLDAMAVGLTFAFMPINVWGNQRDHTHIHQCVENRAQQFHFQHLRCLLYTSHRENG